MNYAGSPRRNRERAPRDRPGCAPSTGSCSAEAQSDAARSWMRLGDGERDLVRLQHAMRREQGLALLVRLADDGGALFLRIQNIADLRLDQRALLLHHHDGGEALGEVADDRGLQRPDHADLEKPDAEAAPPAPRRCRDRRAPGAHRDRPCPPPRCRASAPPRPACTMRLMAVGAGEGLHRRHLVHVQALFLHEAVIAGADRQAARRRRGLLREDRASRGPAPPPRRRRIRPCHARI